MSQNNYIYTNQNITRPSTNSNLGFLPPNNKSHEKSQDMGKHNENNLEKIIEEDATYNTNPDISENMTSHENPDMPTTILT